MTFLYAIEFIFFALLLAGWFLEVLVPIVTNTPTFPNIRKFYRRMKHT